MSTTTNSSTVRQHFENRAPAVQSICDAILILTPKSDSDLPGKRVTKRERVSANRWHLEVRLEQAPQVDRELVAWLRRAYDLSG